MGIKKTRKISHRLAVGTTAVLLCIGLSGCTRPSWKDWAQHGPVLSPTYDKAPVTSASATSKLEPGPEMLAGPDHY